MTAPAHPFPAPLHSDVGLTRAAARRIGAILRSRRLIAPGLTLAMLTAALPLGATPAMAVVTPVAPPHAIEVFPAIDMAGASGFEGPFVMEVWRDGVKVGSSGDPVETDLLELNHDGPPCWSGTTPDIIAGDQIRVITDASNPADPVGEFMTVADLDAEPPQLVALDPDGVANDLVMRGTAVDADGVTPLPIARMAAEVVQPAFRDSAVGWDRRAIGAVPGGQLPGQNVVFDQDDEGVLAYDAVGPDNPNGNRWTATWKNLPGDIGTRALSGEHTIQSWERDNAGGEGVGLTIMDAEDASGPGVGCPPASADAVTSTSRPFLNIAARNAGGDLVIGGTSYNAAGVTVTVDDGDGTSADAVSVPATVSNPASTATTADPVPGRHQTWTASIPIATLTAGGLADGDLTISGQFARVVEERVETPDPVDPTVTVVSYTHTAQPIGGRTMTIVKDLVAPQPPTVFPAGGVYYGTQSVTAAADDPAQETLRYTVAATAAAEPGSSSPVLPAPYQVTASQQLKAAAFDRAGNRSATVTQTYDVRALAAPAAPTGVTATAGVGSVQLSWTAPTETGGQPVTGYAIRVFDSAGRLVQSTEVGPTPTSTLIGALTNGVAYRFDVRAVNAIGTGAPSALVPAVTPRAEFVAPQVATAVPGPNGRSVAAGTNVTVTFTEPVTGVNANSVRLLRAGSTTPVPAVVTYNAATRTATLNPNANLASDVRYTVMLTAGVRDAAGNTLAPTTWSFTTGPRPAVQSRTPGAGATGVPRGSNIGATFSEAVTGVSSTTVQLTRVSDGAVVSGTVSYNATTRRMTFNPFGGSATLLAPRTAYRISISSGVRDVIGNPMAATSWTFTTGTTA